jgi:FkbM family methyltransferase
MFRGLKRRLRAWAAKPYLKREFGRDDFRKIRFVWGDVWKKWHQEHRDYLPLLEALGRGMDAESKAIVAKIFERYVFVTPYQEYSDHFLCDARLLFTASELSEQRRIGSEYSVSATRRLHPLPLRYHPPAIFFYDDGLVFLTESEKAAIRGTDFLDCGAWIGDSALAFRKYGPRRIYAFEPVEFNHRLLQQTIDMNPSCGIVPVKLGLGRGESEVEVFGDLTDASLLEDVLKTNRENDRQKRETIKLTSIDQFVSTHSARPGLIKMDIEGAEMDALIGAVETIRAHRPTLIISIYHTPAEFFGAKPFLEDLGLGYRFKVKRLDPFHPTTETVLIASAN